MRGMASKWIRFPSAGLQSKWLQRKSSPKSEILVVDSIAINVQLVCVVLNTARLCYTCALYTITAGDPADRFGTVVHADARTGVAPSHIAASPYSRLLEAATESFDTYWTPCQPICLSRCQGETHCIACKASREANGESGSLSASEESLLTFLRMMFVSA